MGLREHRPLEALWLAAWASADSSAGPTLVPKVSATEGSSIHELLASSRVVVMPLTAGSAVDIIAWCLFSADALGGKNPQCTDCHTLLCSHRHTCTFVSCPNGSVFLGFGPQLPEETICHCLRLFILSPLLFSSHILPQALPRSMPLTSAFQGCCRGE